MHVAKGIDDGDRLVDLARRFRQQQQFSEDYSPLYAALFGTVAGWLTDSPGDPVVRWLVKATTDRPAFDVSNLLAAGLHHEVLSGSVEVTALAAYYPTVGGDASPEHLFKHNDNRSKTLSVDFVHALHDAILARQGTLATFLKSNSVQTNETGRGISWLLPLCLTPWNETHLIDLGASAGLNLIADQRAFQFFDAPGGSLLAKYGLAPSEQFVIHANGQPTPILANNKVQPRILSRTGCDIHPFHLKTAADERVLASFIWGDQIMRMVRLKEAVAAFHLLQRRSVPVRLFPTSLPDGLPGFLDQQSDNSPEPLIIYNTYVKIYLPNKGKKLHHLISEWAARQNRPVVWIQWEPPQYTSLPNNAAPKFGWLAWTVDLWHNKNHYQYQLGWVHPHGRQVQWLPGLTEWTSFWV